MHIRSTMLALVLGVSCVHAQDSGHFDTTPNTEAWANPSTIAWDDVIELLKLARGAPDHATFLRVIEERALDPGSPLTDDARYEGLMHAQAGAWNLDDFEHAAYLADAALLMNVDLDKRIRAAEWSGRSWRSAMNHQRGFESFKLAFELSEQLFEQRKKDPLWTSSDPEAFVSGMRSHMGMLGGFAIGLAHMSGEHESGFELAERISSEDTYPEERRAQALSESGQQALRLGMNDRAAGYFRSLLSTFPNWGIGPIGERASAGMQLLQAMGISAKDNDPAAIAMVNTIIDDERLQGSAAWFWAVGEAAEALGSRGRWRDGVALHLWAIEKGRERIEHLDESDRKSGMDTVLTRSLSRQYEFIAQSLERRNKDGMALRAWELYIEHTNSPFEHELNRAKQRVDFLTRRGITRVPLPEPKKVELKRR